MELVKQIIFNADLVLERSITSRVEPLGNYNCTMELYTSDGSLDTGVGQIEWVMGVGTDYEDVAANIGVWWNSEKELTDYDGVFSLPKQAVELLEQCGIKVGDDFR